MNTIEHICLVHGLNMRFPGNELAELLLSSCGMGLREDIAIHQPVLPGHESGRGMHFREPRLWLDALAGYCRRNCQGPTLFAGFSLGALLGLAALSAGMLQFEAMILIAPPLKLRFFWQKLLPLGKVAPWMPLPGATPKPYRIHRAIPLSAYYEITRLQRLVREYMQKNGASDKMPPVLLVFDPDDLLVFPRELFAFAGAMPSLSHLELHSRIRGHHLLSDPRATGEAGWALLQARLREFLNQ